MDVSRSRLHFLKIPVDAGVFSGDFPALMQLAFLPVVTLPESDGYRSMKAAIDQQILELFETGQGVEELITQRHELCEVFREEIRSKKDRFRP